MFPQDVIVFAPDGLISARLQRGKGRNGRTPQIVRARAYALPPGTFGEGIVTPLPESPEGLGGVIRRVKVEQGRLERVSLLLPDSWFRINIIEVTSLSDKKGEAEEVVRWALKRSLPMRPEDLRVAFQPIQRNGKIQVLVIAGLEKSLRQLEAVFAGEGIEVVLIEPIGLNIWNAVTVRESSSTEKRLFLYLGKREFTVALFAGSTPLFIRSRSLNKERLLIQEIKLSASYLRTTLQAQDVTRCFLAGNDLQPEPIAVIAEEFGAPVERIELERYAQAAEGIDTSAIAAELTACTGVFTA